MRFALSPRRPAPPRQRLLGFLERRLEHERWFKRWIVLASAMAIVAILAMVPWGRYLTESLLATSRGAGMRIVGLAPTREEIDDSWRRFRRAQAENTRPRVQRLYDGSPPEIRRLLRYGGLDPEHALLGWGNYNWTLLLSSKVFEADDRGRSYRLRPRTRSIWLLGVDHTPVKNAVPLFLIVPDGPGLADAIRGTPARPLESSRQVSNSWGLRGPEPDPDAPLRGMVLGDSYMQGLFLGEDRTPPECLRRQLEGRLKARVSILNAGVMGYSPEQYYHSLIAFADRFRPHFVVVSIFPNDFGDVSEVVSHGVGDWQEGKYWLERIDGFCRERGWPCLIVPVPYRLNVIERRTSGNYPGQIINALEIRSASILNPFDAFVNAHLERLAEAPASSGSHLYNDAYKDGHFSAAGAEVWARVVGDRVLLLLDAARADPARPPGASVAAGADRARGS